MAGHKVSGNTLRAHKLEIMTYAVLYLLGKISDLYFPSLGNMPCACLPARHVVI